MFDIIYKLKQNRKAFVICTIVETSGSTPRKVGTKLVVSENGMFYGTIGGGNLEFQVIEIAKKIIKENTGPQLIDFHLEKDLRMACGGKVKVFFEPQFPEPQLIIFGAGHVGRSLAMFAQHLDFTIKAVDERKEVFEVWQKINAEKIILKFSEAFDKLIFDENTYICAVSHTHNYDLEIAKLCLKKKFAYLGVIASKRKAMKIKEELKKNGFSSAEINKIDMPMGINIECETPEEIAISILAKLIDVKNKRMV